MAEITKEQIKQYGFDMPNMRMFINDPEACAKDAALITNPNVGVPVEYTAYLDPMVIEILTAVRNAKELFKEVKKGDWTVPYAKFKVGEPTGETTPYTDYGKGVASDTNWTFPSREQYLFETVIKYGDLEQDVASVAKINLASEKQRAAAKTIEIDANKFYLFGVAGKNIYGALNEPNIPATLTPATGAGGGTVWSGKTTKEIYEDCLALFKQLTTKSGGQIDANSKVKLALPPASMVELGKATDFNVSAKDMLDKYFRNIEYIVLPELAGVSNMAYMTVDEIDGTPTAQLAFGLKYRAGRLVPRESYFSQKISASTYGCVLYRPFAVATMTGI